MLLKNLFLEGNQNKNNCLVTYEQFLKQIYISLNFLRAKQVGIKTRENSICNCCRNWSQGSCSYFDFPLKKQPFLADLGYETSRTRILALHSQCTG